MRRFWTRQPRFRRTTGPRAGAPEARTDFVSALVEHVRETRRTAPSLRLRFAFAGALTLLLLGSLAGFGGVGMAAAPIKAPVQMVKAAKIWVQYGSQGKATRVAFTPAKDQYDDDECKKKRKDDDRAAGAHQRQENGALSKHQTAADHSKLTPKQREAHYAQEQQALRAHQKGEDNDRDKKEKDCKKKKDKDDKDKKGKDDKDKKGKH